MNKAYGRIEWENYPSEKTPLNEDNLNKIDAALDEVDNRVVTMDMTKLDLNTANGMVKNVSFNEKSGIFTITYLNGSTKELDTKLEKIATNFRYDYNTQKLILTLVDGTTQEIDMKALITQYEFENSAYILWTVTADGKIKADIINGSITADKLQPNFLADVTLQANNAKTSEQNAKTSEENAKQSEINAKNYADSAEPVASTANGLNPALDNSTGAPIISFKGDGATEQQTYSGKNLLENTKTSTTYNGITFTVNADKTITANGTATAIAYLSLPITLSAGTYKLVGCPSGSASGANFNQMLSIGGVENGSGYEFTLEEETTLTVYTARIASGKTVSNVVFKPMITTDLDATYDDYEKFVGGIPSPNPDYPQEIHGVGESGSLEVKTTGKNVFDINKRLFGTVDSSGDLAVQGSGSTFYEYDFKENTQYTFSGYVKNSNASANVRFAVEYTDGTKDNLIMLNATTEYKYAEHTTKGGKTIERIYIDYSVSGNSMYIKGGELQIEEGTEATPYEPYTETKANIPLSAPLYEGDYIKYNMDGSGELVRNIGSVVLNGSESGWGFTQGTDTYYGYVNLSPKAKGNCVNVYSSHFKNDGTTGTAENNIYTNAGSTLIIRTNKFTTLTEWKAWLAENPITVVYERAEPTVTPLTAEQIAEFEKLRTFNGTTNVTCDGNVAVDYLMDSVNGKVVAAVVSKVNNSVKKIEDADSKATQALRYGSDPILSSFDYESGSKENEISTTMTMKQAIQHLQNAVNDIANGVYQNKVRLDSLS